MEWAVEVGRDKRLTHSERAVLVALAYHANKKTGKAWPGVDTLADFSGYSRATVYATFPTLERLLDHVKRPGWTTLWRFPPECREVIHKGSNPWTGGGEGVQSLDSTRVQSLDSTRVQSLDPNPLTLEPARGERATYRDDRGYVYVQGPS